MTVKSHACPEHVACMLTLLLSIDCLILSNGWFFVLKHMYYLDSFYYIPDMFRFTFESSSGIQIHKTDFHTFWEIFINISCVHM
jgi:hypothetical protein